MLVIQVDFDECVNSPVSQSDEQKPTPSDDTVDGETVKSPVEFDALPTGVYRLLTLVTPYVGVFSILS